MYKCCDCGRIFDEPIPFSDREEYWGAPCENKYYVSPCCREAFDEYEYNDDEEIPEQWEPDRYKIA